MHCHLTLPVILGFNHKAHNALVNQISANSDNLSLSYSSVTISYLDTVHHVGFQLKWNIPILATFTTWDLTRSGM